MQTQIDELLVIFAERIKWLREKQADYRAQLEKFEKKHNKVPEDTSYVATVFADQETGTPADSVPQKADAAHPAPELPVDPAGIDEPAPDDWDVPPLPVSSPAQEEESLL